MFQRHSGLCSAGQDAHCRNLRKDVEADNDAGGGKPAHQPAKVLKGDDNTDKTPDQMQGDEVPPQV